MEWQPIETAPKDYQDFLAYRYDQGIFMCRWEWSGSVVPKDSNGDPIEDIGDFNNWWSDIWGWLEGELAPTHWMPLPNPPKGAE